MSDYLEGYGVSEARRARIIKRIVLSLLGIAILGVVLYYQFRDYREERQTSRFFNLLKKKDYQSAYRMWGCSVESPCRDYDYARFMEDWGPDGDYADLSSVKIEKTRSCNAGVIRIVDFGKGEKVNLFVDRANLQLGYAPFEFCNPRWQAP